MKIKNYSAHVNAAQVFDAEVPQPTGTIVVRDPFPFPTSEAAGLIEKCREEFLIQAQAIFHVLRQTLPGGTLDALVAIMIKHAASNLTVSYASFKDENNGEKK